MTDNYKRFIESLDSPNTIKVVNSMRVIGDYDYTNCTQESLGKIILSMKPNSPRAITTICYVMGLYARYLNDDHLYQMVLDIDRKTLWSLAKPYASRKYISHSEFKDVHHKIGVFEDLNGFYYQTLLKCVYEGIYNDDLSVIKNLRASDVRGNTVRLTEENGHSYDMEISEELADDLREIGFLNTWERKNRFSVCRIKTEGVYPDSCFKIEIRKDNSPYSYRFGYYKRLRKIAKEYFEFNLLPVQIYVSGLMYRIGLELEKHNISLEEAFALENRNRIVGKIIADELKRCNCHTTTRNFREMVQGHLDVFDTSNE